MSFLMPKPPKMDTTTASRVPQPEDPAIEEGRRKELARQAAAGGRRSTMLTDYATATLEAPILRATLGGR